LLRLYRDKRSAKRQNYYFDQRVTHEGNRNTFKIFAGKKEKKKGMLEEFRPS